MKRLCWDNTRVFGNFAQFFRIRAKFLNWRMLVYSSTVPGTPSATWPVLWREILVGTSAFWHEQASLLLGALHPGWKSIHSPSIASHVGYLSLVQHCPRLLTIARWYYGKRDSQTRYMTAVGVNLGHSMSMQASTGIIFHHLTDNLPTLDSAWPATWSREWSISWRFHSCDIRMLSWTFPNSLW